MPSEKQPEANDILQEKTRLQAVWQAAHDWWQEVDRYLQGEYPVWVNADEQTTRASYRTNQARTILEHVLDNVLPYKPRWNRDWAQQAKSKGDQADAVEEFVDVAWHDASLKELSLPAKTLGGHMIRYNYGILEAGFDPQEEPKAPEKGAPDFIPRQREYQERQKNFNPFSVTAPHPTTVLLPPYERRPSYAVKIDKWPARKLRQYLEDIKETDAENLVSVELLDDGIEPFEQLLITEYYNESWRALVQGSTKGLLLLEANLSGIVPFRHAFGSFGHKFGGREDANDPRYLAQGFLWPVINPGEDGINLLQLRDQIISAKAELEFKAAYAPMVGPQELLETIARLLQQGANLLPGDIKTLGYLPVQQLPQYLADFQDRVERAIVEATISTVAFGERPVGVDTVGQHAMMLLVSSKRLVETLEQMAFMTGEVGEMWLQMLQAWDRKVTIRGKSLEPEDLHGTCFIDASFPMIDEAVKQQRTQIGAELVKAGLKSRKRHWEEDQGITSVAQEREDIVEDAVLADPILATALADKKRQELQLQELYEEQERKLREQRVRGFNETQAETGRAGVNIPATTEQMLVNNAEAQTLIRPPRSRPGSGQPTNGRGT